MWCKIWVLLSIYLYIVFSAVPVVTEALSGETPKLEEGLQQDQAQKIQTKRSAILCGAEMNWIFYEFLKQQKIILAL